MNPFTQKPAESTYVSQYIPLPSDAITKYTDNYAKQVQQYNDAETKLSSLVSATSAIPIVEEQERVKAIQERYGSKINSMAEDLAVNDRLKGIKKLATDFLVDDDVKSVMSNKTAYDEYQKTLTENPRGSEYLNASLNKFRKNPKGSFSGIAPIEMSDRAHETFNKMEKENLFGTTTLTKQIVDASGNLITVEETKLKNSIDANGNYDPNKEASEQQKLLLQTVQKLDSQYREEYLQEAELNIYNGKSDLTIEEEYQKLIQKEALSVLESGFSKYGLDSIEMKAATNNSSAKAEEVGSKTQEVLEAVERLRSNTINIEFDGTDLGDLETFIAPTLKSINDIEYEIKLVQEGRKPNLKYNDKTERFELGDTTNLNPTQIGELNNEIISLNNKAINVENTLANLNNLYSEGVANAEKELGVDLNKVAYTNDKTDIGKIDFDFSKLTEDELFEVAKNIKPIGNYVFSGYGAGREKDLETINEKNSIYKIKDHYLRKESDENGNFVYKIIGIGDKSLADVVKSQISKSILKNMDNFYTKNIKPQELTLPAIDIGAFDTGEKTKFAVTEGYVSQINNQLTSSIDSDSMEILDFETGEIVEKANKVTGDTFKVSKIIPFDQNGKISVVFGKYNKKGDMIGQYITSHETLSNVIKDNIPSLSAENSFSQLLHNKLGFDYGYGERRAVFSGQYLNDNQWASSTNNILEDENGKPSSYPIDEIIVTQNANGYVFESKFADPSSLPEEYYINENFQPPQNEVSNGTERDFQKFLAETINKANVAARSLSKSVVPELKSEFDNIGINIDTFIDEIGNLESSNNPNMGYHAQGQSMFGQFGIGEAAFEDSAKAIGLQGVKFEDMKGNPELQRKIATGYMKVIKDNIARNNANPNNPRIEPTKFNLYVGYKDGINGAKDITQAIEDNWFKNNTTALWYDYLKQYKGESIAQQFVNANKGSENKTAVSIYAAIENKLGIADGYFNSLLTPTSFIAGNNP